MIDKKGQVTDDENMAQSDPNLVGPQETQGVRDDRAGPMSAGCECNGEHQAS